MLYNSIRVQYTCRRLDTGYLSMLESTYRHVPCVLIVRRKYLICVSMHQNEGGFRNRVFLITKQ